jgi:hypothetical protein
MPASSLILQKKLPVTCDYTAATTKFRSLCFTFSCLDNYFGELRSSLLLFYNNAYSTVIRVFFFFFSIICDFVVVVVSIYHMNILE